MTKQEIYNVLIDDGVKLPPVSKCKKEDLVARFRELYGTSPDGEDETPETPEKTPEEPEPAQEDVKDADDAQNAPETPETEQQEEQEDPQPQKQRDGQPPMLHFSASGWCDALRRSYFVGWFKPVTWEEYDALRPFADGGKA